MSLFFYFFFWSCVHTLVLFHVGAVPQATLTCLSSRESTWLFFGSGPRQGPADTLCPNKSMQMRSMLSTLRNHRVLTNGTEAKFVPKKNFWYPVVYKYTTFPDHSTRKEKEEEEKEEMWVGSEIKPRVFDGGILLLFLLFPTPPLSLPSWYTLRSTN